MPQIEVKLPYQIRSATHLIVRVIDWKDNGVISAMLARRTSKNRISDRANDIKNLFINYDDDLDSFVKSGGKRYRHFAQAKQIYDGAGWDLIALKIFVDRAVRDLEKMALESESETS